MSHKDAGAEPSPGGNRSGREAAPSQQASPSEQHGTVPLDDPAMADYAHGRRERTPQHDAAVGGVGHGGPVAPDPVEDGAPPPTTGTAPGGEQGAPPDEHDPAVHFIE